jgi:hypothetical protein
VADLAVRTGEPAIGAELVGAADIERERAGVKHKPDEIAFFGTTVRQLEQSLGAEAYARECERGRRSTLQAAVAFALEFTERER